MKSFKQVMFEEEDHFASMPKDHLHVETHGILRAHGFDHEPGERGTHDYFNEDDEVDHEHHGLGLHPHLEALGWSRNHKADWNHHEDESGNSADQDAAHSYEKGATWTHPNGSLLHMSASGLSGGGTGETHFQFEPNPPK